MYMFLFCPCFLEALLATIIKYAKQFRAIRKATAEKKKKRRKYNENQYWLLCATKHLLLIQIFLGFNMVKLPQGLGCTVVKVSG